MNPTKLDAVRTYLNVAFPGSRIEENYDFDRKAQTFKIWVDRDVLLLKVDKEFLDDNDEAQIRDRLESWKVANVLRESKEGSSLIAAV